MGQSAWSTLARRRKAGETESETGGRAAAVCISSVPPFRIPFKVAAEKNLAKCERYG